jgi:hypothetical protein
MFVNGIPSTSKIVHVGAIALHSPTKLGGGAFRFNFASTPGLTFTVLSSANVALPSSSWTALGSATEISPGQFQFTDSQAPSNPRRYYRVQAGSSGANSVRVALYVVETDASYALDIKSNIVATGLFSDADVDILPTTSDPTLSQLRQYAAVLTSLQGSSFSDSTTYGNTLADYVDQGGGVVINLYCFFSSSTAAGYGFGGLDGRIVSYLPLAQGDVTGETAHLGMVEDLPSHPLLQGVTTFDGGPYCNRFAIGLNPGGTEVAHWTDGLPLIAVSQPGNGRVVGLNFRAMSTAVSSHGYEAGTDGGRILANALMWAGGASSGP